MPKKFWFVALLGVPAGVLFGWVCDYYPFLVGFAGGVDAAERSGRRDITFAADFDRLYPGGQHYISGYARVLPTWRSVVGLHGRYVLTMKCDITLDVTRTRVAGHDTPAFFLSEVVLVEPGANGTWNVRYGKTWRFGAAEWQQVVAAGGDLGVLGIELTKDEPLPLFHRAWRVGEP
jgi:hypothetical protein